MFNQRLNFAALADIFTTSRHCPQHLTSIPPRALRQTLKTPDLRGISTVKTIGVLVSQFVCLSPYNLHGSFNQSHQQNLTFWMLTGQEGPRRQCRFIKQKQQQCMQGQKKRIEAVITACTRQTSDSWCNTSRPSSGKQGLKIRGKNDNFFWIPWTLPWVLRCSVFGLNQEYATSETTLHRGLTLSSFVKTAEDTDCVWPCPTITVWTAGTRKSITRKVASRDDVTINFCFTCALQNLVGMWATGIRSGVMRAQAVNMRRQPVLHVAWLKVSNARLAQAKEPAAGYTLALSLTMLPACRK